MSYTLRQVRPLLTQPELALFEASRAPAIREFTLRQLVGKITRARNLRDKFRDLHRRQAAETQRRPAKDRKPLGGENSRTETKAEIFAEVLARFEERQVKLVAQEERSKARPARVHQAPGAPAKKTNPASSRSAHKPREAAIASGNATKPLRGAAGTKPRQVARKDRAALEEAQTVVEKRSAAKTPKAAVKKSATAKPKATSSAAAVKVATKAKPATKDTSDKKTVDKKAVDKKAADKKAVKAKAEDKASTSKKSGEKKAGGKKKPEKSGDKKSKTEKVKVPSAAKLVRDVKKAVKKIAAQPTETWQQTDAADHVPVVASGVRELAQGGAPTHLPARAQRVNPLKEEPVNQKIHASQRGRKRAQQAKRDK